MAFYEEVLSVLVQIGLLDVVLPFLVIYIITYGMLQRNKVLGGKKNIDAMVAFCCGFLAIAATQLMNILNIVLAWIVMALVVTIMLALILGLAGAKVQGNKYMTGLAVAIFAIMLLGGLFAAGAITQDQLTSAILLPLIFFGALIGVLIYVLSPKKETEKIDADKIKEKKKEAPKPAEKPSKEDLNKALETLEKAGIRLVEPEE